MNTFIHLSTSHKLKNVSVLDAIVCSLAKAQAIASVRGVSSDTKVIYPILSGWICQLNN